MPCKESDLGKVRRILGQIIQLAGVPEHLSNRDRHAWERGIEQIAQFLESGEEMSDVIYVPGTAGMGRVILTVQSRAEIRVSQVGGILAGGLKEFRLNVEE